MPGDKSISHRAAIFNALSRSKAQVMHFSPGEDCLATVRCLQALGVAIEPISDGIEVNGVGEAGLMETEDILDAANSGTTMRLLTGLLAPQPFFSVLTGDASLRSRPMDRIIQPLRLMGAHIWGREGDTKAPLAILGSPLHGITYRLPVASAQTKSAILLAGLWADGETAIEEPALSRDHTERMLQAMGVELNREGNWVHLHPITSPLKPLNIEVPGDISSAAYFLVAGAVHPQAKVKVKNVGINPTRAGLLDTLRAMGAKLTVEAERWQGGELVADIQVESSQLEAVELHGELIPKLIDEITVLVIAALAAKGTTIIRDAAELRVKEIDRITHTVRELSLLGANIEELQDGMVVHPSHLHGGEVDSHGDHRLAMTLAVASLLVAQGETVVGDAEAVAISYPNFWKEWQRLIGGEENDGKQSKHGANPYRVRQHLSN